MLIALLALASAAPGGRTLMVCLADGDHSHVFVRTAPAESVRHAHESEGSHDHDGCCHDSPGQANAADSECLAADCHHHDCVDIALPGGDLHNQGRKVAQAEIGLPTLIATGPVELAALTPTTIASPQRRCASPPDLLRTTILLI